VSKKPTRFQLRIRRLDAEIRERLVADADGNPVGIRPYLGFRQEKGEPAGS